MLNLECDYKLEGDTLYSLKWSRDDKEFGSMKVMTWKRTS